MEGFEIVSALNGFLVFTAIKPNNGYIRDTPWVFETLDAALKFLKEKLENKSAACGSCDGSGFIK